MRSTRRFECDSALAYQSVILLDEIRVIDDRAVKQRFCEMLLAKYAKPEWDRPKGFFPRLDQITVYAIAVERMTGKETPLPRVAARWSALDRTIAIRQALATSPASRGFAGFTLL